MMVLITGDKHGNLGNNDYGYIKRVCLEHNTTLDDAVIILGDHGVFYDGAEHDALCRYELSKIPITFIMIRGNHDRRPCPTWKFEHIEKDNYAGYFYRDPDYNNIIYTEEFGWYKFAGKDVFVIGGAYSADKYYRLEQYNLGNRGYLWFEDEQLTEDEMNEAHDKLMEPHGPVYIMSHTCPIRYAPREMFLSFIDQSTVDNSMEIWMDDLISEIWKNNIDLKAWFCGHWHTDKTDDIMVFMYHDVRRFDA